MQHQENFHWEKTIQDLSRALDRSVVTIRDGRLDP